MKKNNFTTTASRIVSRTPNFNRYLKDIYKIPLLSPEEEPVLFQKARKGDMAAFERIINSNLRFVVEVAKKYKDKFLSIEDLINEGNMGLIKAAQRFDETRGFKFISYAVFWIQRMILDAIKENSRIVRIPFGVLNAQKKWEHSRNKISHSEMTLISNQLLAYFLKDSDTNVLETISVTVECVEIDADQDSDRYSFLELFENKNALVPNHALEHHESLQYEIGLFLRQGLNTQQKKVAELYYGLVDGVERSKESISEILGLSRERIRQVLEEIHTNGHPFMLKRNGQVYL